MIIRDFGSIANSDARVIFATVAWEDCEYPEQELIFETRHDELEHAAGEPCPDAFLSACFPLAAVHGESRVRIEGRACPMLIEGLYTAHAWWTSRGGMPFPVPSIETFGGHARRISTAPRRAVAFLSGGVDGLHMLMRNRRLYNRDDPAYVHEALFIHGFDIGKRARDFRGRTLPNDVKAPRTGRRGSRPTAHSMPDKSPPSPLEAGFLGAPA